MRILANDGIDAAGKSILEAAGFEVITNKIAQEDLADKINEYDTIIIHRHKSPDLDAVGSQMALKLFLQKNTDKRILNQLGELIFSWADHRYIYKISICKF